MSSKNTSNLIKFFWAVIGSLPLVLPVMVAVFGLVSVFFVLIGSFTLYYVLPIGVILSAGAAFLTYKAQRNFIPHGSRREYRITAVLVLAMVLIWTGFNLQFNSQHVFTNRDPATYTIAGAWLVEHDNLNIERNKDLEQVKGVVSKSAGFDNKVRNADYVEAQGLHMLPSMMGVVGRLFGYDTMFNTNVLIGGVALLAVFALARLIMKPRWALLAASTLAVSLPMIYFSRDSYTEPLTMLLLFSSLAVLVIGIIRQRNHLWLLAGALMGTGALARIDVYLTFAAMVVFLLIFMLASKSESIKKNYIPVGLFLLGMAATTIIGFADVRVLSSSYFMSQWKHILPELILIGITLLSSIIIIAVAPIRKSIVRLYITSLPKLKLMLPWLIIATGIILASRPFWLHFENVSLAQSFNETTVNWLVWYIGITGVVLGFVGLAIMTRIALKVDRAAALSILVVLLVVVASSLLYLVRPSISYDQIWSSRRLLPIVIPGFLIASAFAIQYFYEMKWPKWLTKRKVNKTAVMSVIATMLIFMPTLVTIPFVDKVSYGQRQSVDALCHGLPSSRGTVMWLGIAGKELVMPTRIFCDDIVSVNHVYSGRKTPQPPTKENLAEYARIVRDNGRIPLIGLYGYEKNKFQYDYDNFTVVSSQHYFNIEHVMNKVPRKMAESNIEVYVGVVTTEGEIVRL